MHEEERAPALGLYADVSVIGEEKARGLREAWSAIAERAIADGAAAQAVLLRSGWTPSIATLQQTAYELVCGIDPPVTTLRAWVRRWVRVPGNDRLWLGRELASRVTGEVRAALREDRHGQHVRRGRTRRAGRSREGASARGGARAAPALARGRRADRPRAVRAAYDLTRRSGAQVRVANRLHLDLFVEGTSPPRTQPVPVERTEIVSPLAPRKRNGDDGLTPLGRREPLCDEDV
ncbi:MAG: hypothetical protein M5U28_10975 [Sandaracinaceae bacterium]|nr:hypothetical protein [Sandaracinaceae bacterium]